MPKKTTAKYTVPSIDKSIDIITLLGQKPDLTLKEIYEELQLPVSTCFNIVSTLENRGFVEKNKVTSQYRLGLALMRLGLQIYENIDLRHIAIPIMKELVAKYGETSYLTSIDYTSFEGVVLEKIESLKTVTVIRSVGSKVPLYASATGKSLLSGLAEEQLTEYFGRVTFERFSDSTITTKEALVDELKLIKERGYSITVDEMGDGVSAVSAPIQDFQGKVVAAVSIAGPVTRMEQQISAMIVDVKSAAEKISKLIQK